ncbi:MAG TPA: AraC family transcriptional regulator [Saprospiraceae bacterium]|nr:AraC family transcriptional regulator [Saprospiraceae bacterium]
MIKPKKPSLEKIIPEFGSSFAVKQYIDPTPNLRAPFWHFHPEIELVYVKGGSGKRHIGNHLSYYNDGELVLIGSMLPHYGFTDRLTANESETIIQLREDFLGPDFFRSNEMYSIIQLFDRARAGISFSGTSKWKIGRRIENLPALDNFAKLIELLCILQDLAWSSEYEILNADGFTFEVENADHERVSIIYDHVRTNFQRPIPLEEIAAEVSMTIPAFCRYFKKLSGKTFTRFVNEFRIVHACKLLSEMPSNITEICFESGFNNFSHFNRLFKKITGKSPSDYRKEFRQVLQSPSDSQLILVGE